MDEHAQTVGNFLDDRHAESRRRIAALEAELAERTKERDELRYEKRARSSIDPNERLHNLCDGLAASRAESPYDQESWDLADASNRELQTELAAERKRREAAKKDAARYRWIATHIGSARFTFRKDVQTLQSMTITCGFDVVSAKDAAIDSVIDEVIAED